MPEVAIRPLGLADAEAWGELRHALWSHHSVAELRDELADELAAGFAGFGAFDGPQLIGFAEMSVRSYGDGCETAPVPWLEGIYVLPGRRCRGIARTLLDAVEGWARARGFRELGSDAELENVLSRLSHARWGFEETGRTVMFRKVLA